MEGDDAGVVRGLKDAEEEVGNIMRDREILCVFFLSFYFLLFSCLIFCFLVFQSHPVNRVQLEEKWRSIRESLLLNHYRFRSSSSLSLSIGGESPSPSPSRAFILAPTLYPESNPFFRRPILCIIVVIHEASGCSIGATVQACETHLAAKERELAIKRCNALRDDLGARIRALIECGWVWSEVGKEALRVLEAMETQPGKNFLFIYTNR